MKITIFGKGNMGKAIGDNFDACGNEVEYAGREFIGELGDIIVLAVPYTAVDGILRKWGPKMKDKVAEALTGCRLKLMDAGKLRRAREMEAMGFLQISLASAGKLLWTRGFAIID